MTRAFRRSRIRSQRGSAVVEFALVSVVLVPLFFGILQLGLIWHVKTTLTSAAAEGARHAATFDRTLGDGRRRTELVIDEVFGRDFADQVTSRQVMVGGQPEVEVQVRAQVPVLAFWGPTITVSTAGHAVKERLP